MDHFLGLYPRLVWFAPLVLGRGELRMDAKEREWGKHLWMGVGRFAAPGVLFCKRDKKWESRAARVCGSAKLDTPVPGVAFTDENPSFVAVRLAANADYPILEVSAFVAFGGMWERFFCAAGAGWTTVSLV